MTNLIEEEAERLFLEPGRAVEGFMPLGWPKGTIIRFECHLDRYLAEANGFGTFLLCRESSKEMSGKHCVVQPCRIGTRFHTGFNTSHDKVKRIEILEPKLTLA